MTMLSLSDIQAYLPHRYPFLLIDKVLEIIPKKKIIAVKNVTINEPFFQGHFQKEAIMPGVLIIETMAQAAHILASYDSLLSSPSTQEKYVLAAVNHIKFKQFVLPGDQLKITAETKWERSFFLNYVVKATVDNKLVCNGQITTAKQSSIKDEK